ncbi:TIGR03943 family putative permease subunit [Streptomyces sp. NPDC093595]|uniref:TIGR03943 family putative permease subunit n=1 Tax=Streptomyces sp. NPDC093595 TaxID=3366045 RepID=UPI0038066441
MKRHVQAVLLLLAGTAVLHITLFSRLYLRYVKEELRPFLIASGALLLVLGAVGAVRDGLPFASRRRAHGPGHEDGYGYGEDADVHGDGQGHAHAHGHGHGDGPRIAWVLFLPVLALLLYAPPALGSYTASRGSDNAIAPVEEFRPLPDADPVPLALTGFIARVQQDRERSLAGRTVLMSGFVTPAPREGKGAWYLTRLVVSCCAADTQRLRVRVHGVPSPPADTWVTVTGTWRPGGAPGTATAAVALDARSVRRIPEPVDPYQDAAPLP